MPRKNIYTRLDNAGMTVQEGDRVTVLFEGVVRSIDKDGRMVLKTPQGFITSYDPDYQGLLKVHTNATNA